MLSRSRFTRVGYRFVLIAFLVGFSLLHRQTAAAQQTWSLPAPWSARDIGNPAILSTGSFDQGTFTITAEGSDIGGQWDQFNFVYQQVTGDVEVIARVDSVSAADRWSKSGVMIRSSLAADAAHGYALVSAGRGVAFQRRLNNGGASGNTFGPSVSAPYWVRLVRKGTTVTAYSSPNGTTWTTISSKTISLGATAYVGIATTSHNTSASTTATVSQVSVNTLSLPAPQQAADIGAPTIQGSTSYSQGVYRVHAGGADIWGTSDQFHFVYQPLSGDGEVIARVQSITNSNTWAKTGVMIRETLSADSRNAFALLSAGNGYAFQRRIDAAGITQSTAGTAGIAPGWVRLVRTGSRIDAYQSINGTTWTLIGSDAVAMANNVYVGIATTSHSTSVATDAVLDNFKVTQGTTTNSPPTVAITSPTGGSTFTAGNNVTVTAAANDSDGTVSRVDFFTGTTQIGSDTTAPYSATWSNVAAGTYTLTAKAVDNDGASTTSLAVSVQVNAAANQPPTVSLTAPANGASYPAPANISLTASANDTDGTISKVEFYNGTNLLTTDTTSPYSYSWTNVAAGTYSLRAAAYDNAGANANSTTVTITVSTASANGLVASYALNEGAGSVVGDTSGTGPAGTITNATWTNGRYGQALSFAGSGEVNFGDVDLTGSFTVMGWLQTRSLYGGTCGSFVMKMRDYGFEICGGQLYGEVGANGAWTGRVARTLTTSDLNVWRHVALTYDGSTVRMYFDGTLVNSTTGAHTTNNNPLLFGHWYTGATEYFDGLVDEVRLYSRVLTAAEIQTDMNSPISGTSGNKAPTVTLTSPANGASFTAPASVVLTASASDSDGTIARVEFYNGTTLLNTDTTATYSFTWSSVAAGTYSLRAVAYDNSGANATSTTATVTVVGANQAPAVTLTSPANGSTFTAPASVTLGANASDSDGTIAKVEFYNGTTLLNTDTSAPYSFAWLSVAAGTYTVKAIAYDNTGASTSSATSTITVSTSTTTPPTGVIFTASPDHATLVTYYELRIYAPGANPNTATPIATSNLGKPTPASNNDITVNQATFFSALTVGNYVAAVAAVGTGGSSVSTGVTFTR
ncbi:MAG TPA: Ig-like domain-containing protein [Vicinamibacterales bacterium]|nr:Ig-like domain-containing protein [Vicinamibacterales bacterium]